jgi:membrane-bound lytic murein transglycosylase B
LYQARPNFGYGVGFTAQIAMTDTSPKPLEQLNTPSWPFFGGNARPQGPLARTCWAAVLALTLSGASVQANPAGSTQPAAQAAPAERQAKPPSKAKAKPKTKPKRKSQKSVEPVKKGKPAAAAPLIGTGAAYAERAPVMQFASELAERRQLSPDWVRRMLGQARQSPAVVALMQPPPTSFVKNWRVYRSRFIDEVRIKAGLRFWEEHQSVLQRAQSVYGVPAQIIVGVIGVETLYGREMGRFRVIDALSTLAFDFPVQHPRAAERSDYFRKELEQFLVAQNQLGLDPLEALGSYAGATGLPQFMPSSIASFAVDFDGDGRIDLRSSASDAIGSVARYLQAFGWRSDIPTHYPVTFTEKADMPSLLAPDILPTFNVASFQEKGALLQGPALEHKGPLALIELLNGGQTPSYVAGTENFYAITRYNWSSYYAMAVIDLGQEVANRFKARP